MNCQSALTVSIARKAIYLVQPGVRFAHGVEFWMPKRTLLSRTHTELFMEVFKHAKTCMGVCVNKSTRSGMTEKEGRGAFWDAGQKK